MQAHLPCCRACFAHGLYVGAAEAPCRFCPQTEAVFALLRYFTRATSEWTWADGKRVRRKRR